MIFIEIKGGQGNQMFQYSLGRYLSIKEDTKLYFETRYFGKKSERGFALGKFNTIGNRPKGFLNYIINHTIGKPIVRNFLDKINYCRCYFEPEGFDNTIMNLPEGHKYFSGYWANAGYFNEIRDVLKKDFTLRESVSTNTKIWEERIVDSDEPTVSLHIRRGDYINVEANRKIFKILPLEYYKLSINELVDKYKKISVFIFSNDLEWAKKNFKNDDSNVNYNFVDANDEAHGYEDMYLMWKCQHHIIANSTFSWWGAYLAEKEGMTFAPSKWFNPECGLHDTSDSYPEDWNVVEV